MAEAVPRGPSDLDILEKYALAVVRFFRPVVKLAPPGSPGKRHLVPDPCLPRPGRLLAIRIILVQTLVQRIGPLLFFAASAAGFWYAGARSLEPGGDRVEVSWLIPVNDMKLSLIHI